jgi:hypothetical protein
LGQKFKQKIKIKKMEEKELKKLNKEYIKFFAQIIPPPSQPYDIEKVMAEFWFSKFGVSNPKRETELLKFWRENKEQIN